MRRLLTKHGPTALGLISELSRTNFSLFAFDGVVVLAPGADPATEEDAGHLVLPHLGDGRWGRTIERPLTWRDEEIGAFAFELEMRRADAA